VTRFICASGVFTEAQIDARLRTEIENGERYRVQYWPIFSLETGDLVGCCGFRPHDLEHGAFELGFHLRPVYWGQKYALEAGAAVLEYTFSHLKACEIVAGHHPQNAASRKVLERLGFCSVGSVLYPPTGLMHPSYVLLNPLAGSKVN
jgi:[ribosomal protein S5]-alanine N-acetyltransferase